MSLNLAINLSGMNKRAPQSLCELSFVTVPLICLTSSPRRAVSVNQRLLSIQHLDILLICFGG